MKVVYPHYGILPSTKKDETTDPKTDAVKSSIA